MLPKKKRVTKGVFQILLKEGKTFSTQLFLFYFIKGESPQYAVVAPKNIFKSATERNKYRRIGYNVLRSYPVKLGTGIFMYKKQAISASTQDIKENIVLILNKFNLI
jgi:ribonuclease P protein component